MEEQEQLSHHRDVPAGTDFAAETSAKAEGLHDLLAHTRADALVAITEHFLSSSDKNTQWQGLKGSESCQLMLHVDINTLRRQGEDCDYGMAIDTLLRRDGAMATFCRNIKSVMSNLGAAFTMSRPLTPS